MPLQKGIENYSTLLIPIYRWIGEGGMSWEDVIDPYRTFLRYIEFVIDHRNGKSSTVIDMTKSTDTQPLYYLEPIKNKEGKLWFYLLHILIRNPNESTKMGVYFHWESIAVRKRKNLDENLANHQQLYQLAMNYLSFLSDETLKSFGLYYLKKKETFDVTVLHGLLFGRTRSQIQSILECLDQQKPNALGNWKDQCFVKDKTFHGGSNLYLLESLQFTGKFPTIDNTTFKVAHVMDQLRNVPIYNMEKQQERIQSGASGSFSSNVEMYNDIIKMMSCFNQKSFDDLEKAYSLRTPNTMSEYTQHVNQFHFDRLKLFRSLLELGAPKKLQGIYSVPLNALRQWMYAYRETHGKLYFFHRKSRKTGENKPYAFKMMMPQSSVFANWMHYLLEGIKNIEYSAERNNHLFLTLHDGSLSQFSNKTDLRHYCYLQGNFAVSKSYLLLLNKSMSLEGTYSQLPSRPDQISETRQNYSFWYCEEGMQFRKGKDSEALVTLKELLTTNTVEKTVIQVDPVTNKRYTVIKRSDLKFNLIIASNYMILEDSFASRFAIFNVFPGETDTEIDELKIARDLEQIVNPTYLSEFKEFNKDILCLTSLSNMAIGSKVTFPVITVGARIILLELVRILFTLPIFIVVHNRDIDRMIHAMTNKCIATSWISILTFEESPSYGSSWNWETLVEASKRQVITLEMIVWTFSQYFETFQNQMMQRLFEIISIRILKVDHDVTWWYSEMFRYVRPPGMLGYGLDLLSLFWKMDCYNGGNTAVGFATNRINGTDYVDFNYFVFRGSSQSALMEVFHKLIKGSTIYSAIDLGKFFSAPSPIVRCKKVLEYVLKDELSRALDLAFANRTMIAAKFRELATEAKIDPSKDHVGAIGIIQQFLMAREVNGVNREVKDGKSFHSLLPSIVYRAQEGLPVFKLIKKDMGGVELRVLVDCFRYPPNVLLKEGISRLSSLVYGKNQQKHVSILTDGIPTIVSITGSEDPHLYNYKWKGAQKTKQSVSFIQAMHEHSSDSEESDTEQEDNDFEKQIKTQERIHFGKMDYDEYMQRIWLKKHGITDEREISSFLK